MPAPTPRGYPYSIPTDPADVPQAIQDLAEAIDVDVQAVTNTISARPAFRVSGGPTVSIPTAVVAPLAAVLSFDSTDMVVGGAIDPLPGATSYITPQLPGFWWFQGTLLIPRTGVTSMDRVGMTLETATETLVRTTTHVPPPVADATNALVCNVGAYFNGTTDYIRMFVETNVPAFVLGRAEFRSRYLLGFRMTES